MSQVSNFAGLSFSIKITGVRIALVINSSQVDQRQAGVRLRQTAGSSQGPVGVPGPHRRQHLRLPKFRVEWRGKSNRICA